MIVRIAKFLEFYNFSLSRVIIGFLNFFISNKKCFATELTAQKIINSFATTPLAAQYDLDKLAKRLSNSSVGLDFRKSCITLANNITEVGIFRNRFLCLLQARNHLVNEMLDYTKCTYLTFSKFFSKIKKLNKLSVYGIVKMTWQVNIDHKSKE